MSPHTSKPATHDKAWREGGQVKIDISALELPRRTQKDAARNAVETQIDGLIGQLALVKILDSNRARTGVSEDGKTLILRLAPGYSSARYRQTIQSHYYEVIGRQLKWSPRWRKIVSKLLKEIADSLGDIDYSDDGGSHHD